MEGMKQGGLHPTREELERFMRGELSREETRAVVRHMVTDCPKCLAVTRPLWLRGDRAPGLEAELAEMLSENGGAPGPTHDGRA